MDDVRHPPDETLQLLVGPAPHDGQEEVEACRSRRLGIYPEAELREEPPDGQGDLHRLREPRGRCRVEVEDGEVRAVKVVHP